MIRRIVFCLALALVIPVLAPAQQVDTIAERFAGFVNASILREHLTIIASDAYEGRETGRKGQKMAADYIRKEFARLKLTKGNDTSYLQNYPLVVRKPANIDFTAGGVSYQFKKDFYTTPTPEFQDQVFDTGEIIFLGYGINDSLLAYNDYKKAPDLKGKVVMIYPGEPRHKDVANQKNGTSGESKWSASETEKLMAAEKAGAKTVLFISAQDPALTLKFSGRGGERMKIPTQKTDTKETLVFHVSKEMGDKIMGTNLEAVIRKSEEKWKPRYIRKKTPLKIDIHRDEQGFSGDNVIGVLEGTTKKNEYVFITAHYDHLGIINNEIYNGADDDGSGTVSVLALARAFAKAKEEGHGPERTIVFMTVSGEEKGLLGSGWFVEHPTVPLNQIECDLNIDMIGRVDDFHLNAKDYVYIIGSDKLSSELHAINEQANAAYTKLKLDYTYNDVNDPNRFYYRSDHYNFAKNNIPVIFYFNGTHADYHQESDEVDKIDFSLMEKRARLVFYTAWDLANRPQKILVDSHKK